MKECKLCGGQAGGALCETCNHMLDHGHNPVVCATCRDVYGPAIALTWIPQDAMSDAMKSIMTGFAEGTVPMFVRESCSACERVVKPSMKQETQHGLV